MPTSNKRKSTARVGGTAKTQARRAVASNGWPNFSADAPPADWERQHDVALQVTVFNPRGRAYGWHTRNRPVPRRADCDYLRDVHGGTDFYFM